MSDFDLTTAQHEVLRTLTDRIPIEQVERVWIFPAHVGKSRETGLVVVSTETDEAGTAGLRGLVTIRYSAEMVKDQLKIQESVHEEGWAPPDRIERVISGVLTRAGEEAGDPIEVVIRGDAERWQEELDELGIVLDPASQ